jgi:putative ABC transport system ATP-binding protein
MMAVQPAVVSARGLRKAYPSGEGQVLAVDAVDLDIGQGDFVSLMGPSGSGKSTLLYLIGTLEKPDAGSLSLDGRDVAGLKPKSLAELRRRLIGFVFQQFHLIPTLTALDHVMVPLAPYAKRRPLRERASSLLAAVGLEGRAHHLPSQLSGGEQQRVAIARALIAEPRLILADEPTGNLDSASGEQVVKLLLDLVAGQGVTLIIATHDTELAGLASTRLRMRDGV